MQGPIEEAEKKKEVARAAAMKDGWCRRREEDWRWKQRVRENHGIGVGGRKREKELKCRMHHIKACLLDVWCTIPFPVHHNLGCNTIS